MNRVAFYRARSEKNVLAGAEGRGARQSGGGGAALLPHPQQLETNISGRGKLEIVGDLEKGGAVHEEGPSQVHRPLLPPGCLLAPSSAPHFRGVGNAVMGGWLAGCSSWPQRSFPLIVLPTPPKGLKTEGQLPKAGTRRGSGAPLSPPFASSPLLLRLHFPT